MSRFEIYQGNERWATVVSHILVSLMMVCLTVSLAQILGRFVSLSEALPVWGGVMACEAFLSYRITRFRAPFSSEGLLARGAEIVVLLAVIKLIMALQGGIGALMQDLPGWEQNFFRAFLTGDYLAVIFILFTIWTLSTLYTNDLAELEGNEFIREITRIDPEPMAQARPTAALYGLRVDDETLPSNRRAIHNHLLVRTLTVGVVMVIIAGLLRQDQFTIWQDQPLSRASVFNVLLFFVLGLALFSQTNFLALRASWGYEHVSITRHLASRWIIYSLIFLIGLGAIALILPTRYSLDFLDTLSYALGFLRMIIVFIFGVIMLPFLLLMRLLAMLFGGGNEKPIPDKTQPVIPTQTPAPDLPAQTPLPWWDVLKSFLFWGVFLAIIGFAVYQYIQQNQALLAALRGLPVWQWLKQAWCWLRSLLRTARRSVTTVVRAGLEKLRTIRTASPTTGGWRFLNPYRLTPRQRVIFFYLALLRRGNEAGYPRQPSQTPYEYEQFLEPDLPEDAQALADMTEAFLEARYSRHEVTSEQVSRVKRAWEQVRNVLKTAHRRLVDAKREETSKQV